MAKGEGDSHLKSSFVERVVKLPMVHVVWDYASNTYTHIKESNRLVNFTLTNAEKTATFVAGQAKPVVLKFEKQIQAVDELACRGLGTLEKKVPLIKKPADEIIEETKKLAADTVSSRLDGIVKYGNQRVRSVTDFGMRQATNIFGERLVQSAITTVDDFLVVSQSYVDRYFTPLKEENRNGVKKSTDDEDSTTLSRAVHLLNTIRIRTYQIVAIQYRQMQERSLDLLLTYPIQIIEFSKTHLDAAFEYANKFWLAIRQGEVDETDASERSQVENQLLYLAQLVSKQVASAYSSFSQTSTESSNQEPSRTVVASTAVRDGAMWIMGMLKLIPQLLPMYIYGLAAWFENKRNEPKGEGKKEINENGSGPNHSTGHNDANNVQQNHVEETNH